MGGEARWRGGRGTRVVIVVVVIVGVVGVSRGGRRGCGSRCPAAPLGRLVPGPFSGWCVAQVAD